MASRTQDLEADHEINKALGQECLSHSKTRTILPEIVRVFDLVHDHYDLLVPSG
jgi:hypothetical protein